MRLALLSTTRLPAFLGKDHPAEASLFGEDDLLAAALGRLGIRAERVPWRTAAEREGFDAALIRSTWDYIDHLDEYIECLVAIERSGARLVNNVAAVRWNIDKGYLLDLERLGIGVVPTRDTGGRPPDEVFRPGPRDDGWVVKPATGVGGYAVRRFDNAGQLGGFLEKHPGSRWLIQPFMPAIASEGEWSFVFAGGRFRYAALKRPARGDYRVQVMYGATTAGRQPAAADLECARRVFEALPVEAGYARIDMVRAGHGGLLLMEAELIEPQLYFNDLPEAADRFARGVLDYLSAAGIAPGITPCG